ncbi:MAG: 4'-phosphopantetheinyl transferase superfamily protein [Clostridia bacterium]|nr:4'-phosphopantetheinyl transferase superfamily protein [Clostridia bacterium]
MLDDNILFRSVEGFTLEEYRAEYRRQPQEMKDRLDRLPTLQRCQTADGRIMLRQLMTERFGKKNFQVTYNQHGQPQLKNAYCSIAHSGLFVVCTVSERPVGLDIERVRELQYVYDCPIFTPQEEQYIRSGEDPDERFLYVWTRKEAYAKREGLPVASVARETVLDDTGWASFRTMRYKGCIISTCRPWDYEYSIATDSEADYGAPK